MSSCRLPRYAGASVGPLPSESARAAEAAREAAAMASLACGQRSNNVVQVYGFIVSEYTERLQVCDAKDYAGREKSGNMR